jgi:hypothetical protein
MHGKREEWIQKERDHWDDLDLDGEISFKWILQK